MLDTVPAQTGVTLLGDDVGLRELRIDRVMTQQELATKAGVAKLTITNIENGKVRPYPQTLRKLAKALDVPPTALAEHLRTPRRQRPLPEV